MSIADRLLRAGRKLSDTASALRFGPPVAFVYNPLDYARRAHARYVKAYADGGEAR